jgi:hypothetical protein
MATTTTPPVRGRRGRATCLTLDFDAEALLRAMAPSGKSLGLMVSELIRKEAERRAERPRLLAALAAEARGQVDD